MVRCGGPPKNSVSTVSNLGGYAGLQRTESQQFLLWAGGVASKNSVLTVSTLGGCGGLQTTESQQFLYWKGVVVFKEHDFNTFYFGQVV